MELQARYVIWQELYEKVIDIEAKTLVEMAKTQILPNAYEYQSDLTNGYESLTDVSGKLNLESGILDDRKELLESISAHIYYVRKNVKEIEDLLEKSESMELEAKTAFFFNELKPQMEHVRKHVDALESVMPDAMWQLPKYREMLFIA